MEFGIVVVPGLGADDRRGVLLMQTAILLHLSDTRGAWPDGSRLYAADMIGADLSRATFGNAELQGASLIVAHLSGANLGDAYLLEEAQPERRQPERHQPARRPPGRRQPGRRLPVVGQPERRPPERRQPERRPEPDPGSVRPSLRQAEGAAARPASGQAVPQVAAAGCTAAQPRDDVIICGLWQLRWCGCRIGGELRGTPAMQRTAQCQCGSLRAVASGEPRFNNICSCQACQRRTGSVIAAGAYFLTADVRCEGASKVYIHRSDSGREVHLHCVDGGVNPRKSGDDRKFGTRFAPRDQPFLAIIRSDANGCPVALCQRRQPPKAGAVGQRLQRVAGQPSLSIKTTAAFALSVAPPYIFTQTELPACVVSPWGVLQTGTSRRPHSPCGKRAYIPGWGYRRMSNATRKASMPTWSISCCATRRMTWQSVRRWVASPLNRRATS